MAAWGSLAPFGVTTPQEDAANPIGSGAAALTPGILAAIAKMVTLPGRAMQQGITTEEAIPWAADTALNLAGGGMPMAEKGAAGIFGGRLAKTADQGKLAQAEEMAGKGATRDEIWNSTGWFQGPDKQWRFEIPDNASVVDASALRPLGRLQRAQKYLDENEKGARLGDPRVPEAIQREALMHADQTANSRGTIPMSQYLVHDDLYAAYPATQHMPLGAEVRPDLRGSFDPSTNIVRTEGGDIVSRGSAKDSTVLHELQHKIQETEGFAKGADPEQFRTPENQRMKDIYDNAWTVKNRITMLGEEPKVAAEYIGKSAGIDPETLQTVALRYSPVELRDMVRKHTPNELYKRQAGEVEARNVQKRMNMTPEERQVTPPWATQDIPSNQQIVNTRSAAGPFGSLAPLPMDEASRMARASDLGFYDRYGRPRALFHETKGENILGLESSGFDLNRVGARAGDEQMPNGVFMKDSPLRIGLGGETEAQMPLMHRADSIKQFEDRGDLGRWLERDAEYQKHASALKEIDRTYNQKYQELEKRAWTRERTPDSEAAQKDLDALLAEWGQKTNDGAAKARERATQLFKDAGYSGIRVQNDLGSFNRKTNTTVIFDPEKVRSRYAAFDPAEVNSRDLLAGLSGLGIFGSLAPRSEAPQ